MTSARNGGRVRGTIRGVTVTWWLRQAGAMADPAGPVAGRVALERAVGQRRERLATKARDGLRQRVRPSRPRMRALVLHPGGKLAFRSVPAPPPPGPLGAVVHPIAIATCDLDRPMCCGHTPFAVPLQYGHECVAEVLQVGSEVTSVRPGDRVIVPFQISCGACAACAAGHTANCLAVPPISMYGFGITGGHWGGAVADELAVPFADGMLVPLPEGVDPQAAASVADNVADAYRHVGPYVGRERLVIVGAMGARHAFTPSVSFYTALIAGAIGIDDVLLVDARPWVRERATALGIEAVDADEGRRRGPSPLVTDISATPKGLAYALSLTAPDGVCSSSGSLHARSRIPTALMYGRNATLTFARCHARAQIPQVLELMAERRLAPERVTSAVAGMDDAPDALAEHMRGPSVKTIITA